MKDELGPWRNKDPLSLEEAGAVLCDTPPGRTYDKTDTEQRHRQERVFSMDRELIRAIDRGELRIYAHTPQGLKAFQHMPGGVLEMFPTWKQLSPADWEAMQRVLHLKRADLAAWCAQRGFEPSIFRDFDPPAKDRVTAPCNAPCESSEATTPDALCEPTEDARQLAADLAKKEKSEAARNAALNRKPTTLMRTVIRDAFDAWQEGRPDASKWRTFTDFGEWAANTHGLSSQHVARQAGKWARERNKEHKKTL